MIFHETISLCCVESHRVSPSLRDVFFIRFILQVAPYPSNPSLRSFDRIEPSGNDFMVAMRLHLIFGRSRPTLSHHVILLEAVGCLK